MSSFGDSTGDDGGSSCGEDELEKPFSYTCVWQINSKLVLISEREITIMVMWTPTNLTTSKNPDDVIDDGLCE